MNNHSDTRTPIADNYIPWQDVIKIKTVAGQSEYKLPDKSMINKPGNVIIGLRVRPYAADQRTIDGDPLINEVMHKSAHLTIAMGNGHTIIEGIPFVSLSCAPGEYQDVNILGGYDHNKSKVKISGAITADQWIEIEVLYTRAAVC